MIAKLLLQNAIFVVALGALLFASAGTLHWPAAWVFLVTSAILGPACGLWLAKTDPALLAERMRPTFQADQPAADGTRTPKPTQVAPLPPGQGTRIDRLA